MNQSATEYLRTLASVMQNAEVTDQEGNAVLLDEGAKSAAQMIITAGEAGRKVMLVGNGGSAAIVSHVHNDICKAVGVRALVFNEQPLLTALSNDIGYEAVFERPIQLWAEPGDLLIAVSSSGRSENIIRGAMAALRRGCMVITYSGFSPDNTLRKMGDLNFYVASDFYGHVETAHAALTHLLTDTAMTMARQAVADESAKVEASA